jgi:hypothetical protein
VSYSYKSIYQLIKPLDVHYQQYYEANNIRSLSDIPNLLEADPSGLIINKTRVLNHPKRIVTHFDLGASTDGQQPIRYRHEVGIGFTQLSKVGPPGGGSVKVQAQFNGKYRYQGDRIDFWGPNKERITVDLTPNVMNTPSNTSLLATKLRRRFMDLSFIDRLGGPFF